MSVDEYTCPICGSEEMVLPYGPKTSPILLVGKSPGQDEVKKGMPFVGATGGVLRDELDRVDVDIRRIRKTNLWLHPENKNEECRDYGVTKVLEEAKNKKLVLLISAETVKFFCNESVEEWNSLLVPCEYFSGAKVMACVQPTTVWHGGVGEIRLALTRFADIIHKENLL